MTWTRTDFYKDSNPVGSKSHVLEDSDGNILILFSGTATTSEPQFRKHSPDGTLLSTYDFTGIEGSYAMMHILDNGSIVVFLVDLTPATSTVSTYISTD